MKWDLKKYEANFPDNIYKPFQFTFFDKKKENLDKINLNIKNLNRKRTTFSINKKLIRKILN